MTDLAAARAAATAFAIPGRLVTLERHDRGHIHDTFVSSWHHDGVTRRYLHQRMNDRVFGDVPALMHNIERVTRHLRERAGANGCTLRPLQLVPARAGGWFTRDAAGAWRSYHYVDGTESHDRCRSPEQAFEAARAFGAFQARLADLDPSALHETIPGFFDARHRLRQLDRAVASALPARLQRARSLLEFVAERRAMVTVVEERIASGAMPRRIVHGDTKLNNVLFDRQSGAAVCVVDLDTCMPAWSLYDFGDLVRFTAATSAEDEPDSTRAGVDLELYRALVAGYLHAARDFLSECEIDLMPFAARLVTFTIGMRFLADFLAGDVYFKTRHPEHNLDRARVQMAMVEAMERAGDEMAAAARA